MRRHHLLRVRSPRQRDEGCATSWRAFHRTSGRGSGLPHRHLLKAAQQSIDCQPSTIVEGYCDAPLLSRGAHAAPVVVVEQQLLGPRTEGRAGRLQVHRLVVEVHRLVARTLRVPNLHPVGRTLSATRATRALRAFRVGGVKLARV